jgi:hypothetical protein
MGDLLLSALADRHRGSFPYVHRDTDCDRLLIMGAVEKQKAAGGEPSGSQGWI